MAGKTILIGCRLPHGLIISNPLTTKGPKVTIAGINQKVVLGATYVTTEVDAELWQAWKTVYSNFAALKNGAIFEASGVREAADKAKELVGEKTGFEPMPKEQTGITELKAS